MAIIKYNSSSDSNNLRSGSAIYNIPTSVEDYSSETVLSVNNTYGKGNLFDQNFLETDSGANYKCFDYSSYINNNSPYKKFHQITFYLGTGSILTANLPDNISYSIGNNYSQPLSWTANGMINLLMQSINGNGNIDRNKLSGVWRASTARIWSGTQPLALTFKINVVDDTNSSSHANFQECLKELGRCVLPGGWNSSTGLYTNPPYGAHLSVKYKSKNGTLGSANYSKKIDVLVGGVLYCKNLALTSMQVVYDNPKVMLLHNYSMHGGNRLLPMTAQLILKLETVEGLTENTYTSMLMLSENFESQMNGDLSIDITGILGTDNNKDPNDISDVAG